MQVAGFEALTARESGLPSVAKFSAEIKAGKLVVVGAIYDFRDKLRQGSGKLHVLSINGKAPAEPLASAHH